MVSNRLLSRLSLAAVLAAGLATVPAHAMTAKECHAAFQSAKKGGTLNGQSYKAFKAANCGTETPDAASAAAAPAAATAPTTTVPVTTGKANPPDSSVAGTKAPIASKSAPVTSGNVVFPSAVSSQYSSLSAGKARMKTCVAQYNANKANGGNGNLKWIQKGGGYWSQCNSRLKGE
ncbi:hypothetical protein Gbth_025_022 [Gluconobacter thailandicus F149-1 = NBRC 100600]|nr:hypothetical protein Gbth_025_022 [Gluconobacter thailandicus F149-1 = NBRC 100600]GBR60014.1 hypothetical protein AA100600_1642 [Gluconobacter thailandicus F149-1 = NBRC 100600]GEL86127.1 hypothetical protein GTH01_04850 [Gluconobacter thailandicus F149-1 = NBRC 100600]